MNNNKNIGNYGENLVCNFLRKNNCEILLTNYHSKYGEIDIIAENIKYILFVEVKTRNDNSLYRGLEAVDISKQHRIIKTAYDYINEFDISKQPRFDVAEVIMSNNKYKLNYYKNYFGVGVCELF